MSRAELTRRVGAPQRRMPRHLLPAFCLSLLLLGCACGPAYAANVVPDDSVTLFKARGMKTPKKLYAEVFPEHISSFASPFLVGGSGVMVALAEVRYRRNGESKRNVDIAARYIETEGPDWIHKTTEKKVTNWETQLVLQGKTRDSVLRNPTAVIKGNKIYLLVLNQTNKSSQNVISWHFELSVGTVTGEVGSKKIEWGPSESLHSKLTQEVEKMHLKVFPGSSHPTFLTSNGTILFSVSATNKEGAKGNAILQLKDDEEQWKVSFVKDPEECRLFSLFEWKERLISVFFGCSTETNYAKEYDKVKEEWKDVDDRLLHVWISEHKPSDLYSVTIESKTALLFIEEPRSTNWDTSMMPLWYTDGNRMKDSVWPIETLYEDFTYGGFLYTNGELFVMYQDISKGLGAIVLTHLKHQLREMDFLRLTWAENDAYLSKPCDETAPEDASPDTLCVTPMPTDGLVGFLSDGGEHPYWNDEYEFRDAEVKGGTKVKNGYTFRGADSGAQLRVVEAHFRKGYKFTKYGLTVVATVTVHETPKDDAPLLTVDGPGSNERLGLWYKGNQWKVVSKNYKEEPATDLEVQKEHRVSLVLQNNTFSVYVDGKSRGSPLPIFAPREKLFDITNIFIGASDYGSGIKMTVTNVFLYNRVLNDTELKAASKTVATATSTDSEKTPEPAIDSSRLQTNTRAGNKARESNQYVNRRQQTPEESKERAGDSSVCLRMGFTLLFLLGCFCIAIF